MRLICVIGCGASGLAALRVLSEEITLYPINWNLYGFERTNSIGGIWNYDQDISKEFITPMYEKLRTNLPKEVMSYPDFPFENSGHSFLHHSDVLKYLKDYVTKNDLEKFIKFNSDIKFVEPVTIDNITKWNVSVTNTITKKTEIILFDVVIVANGHFEQTHLPEIKGIEYFKGEFIHSKYYRKPEKYNNKSVLVLGARNSGIDIVSQLTEFAKKVYLAHNYARLRSQRFLKLITETYGISEINSEGFICTRDGQIFEVDVIICCTGYHVSLDFLSESCKIKYDNSYIRPLYKHLISPHFPTSLFFIGICYEITPFTFFYMQSKVVRAIIQNCAKNISLSTQDLLGDISGEMEQFDTNNVLMRHRHFMNVNQWPYYEWCKDVSREIINAKIPKHMKYLFEMVKEWRSENVDLYREVEIEVCDDNDLGFIIKSGPKNDFYSAVFDKYLRNKSS